MRLHRKKITEHIDTAKATSKRHIYARPYIVPVFGLLLAILLMGTIFLTRGDKFDRPSESHVVFLSDGDSRETLSTKVATVGELISKLPLNLVPEDVVEPSLDTPIVEDNFRINVYRARPVTIIDKGLKNVTFTAKRSARVAAQEANVKIYPEDTVTFETGVLSENIIGEKVVIDRATPIVLNLYGRKVAVRTQAATVAELLKEKEIVPAEGDTLKPSSATLIRANMSVALIRNGIQVVTVEEVIAAPVQTVQDSKLSFGATAVRQAGSNGKREVTYRIETRRGKEVSRVRLQQVIVETAVPRIVAVGAVPFSGSLQTWLLKLRQCEAGGNYKTNTGNGYYGAYQFAVPTWNSLKTGYARADLAPPSVQDRAVIANTNRSSGGLATQHPGCYKKLGLSKFPPSNR